MTPSDVDRSEVDRLVRHCALVTRWTHTYWDQQVRTAIIADAFPTWEELDDLFRRCAKYEVNPLAVVKLLNDYTQIEVGS